MKTFKNCSPFLIFRQPVFSSNKLKSRRCLLLLLTSLLSFSISATEVNGVNTDTYVLNSCNAFKVSGDNNKTWPCVTYIKGFFNGLLNVGHSNAAKIEQQRKKPTTLVERAYANRVGKLSNRKPMHLSCMTVDELKEVILNGLADGTTREFHTMKQLNGFLINALSNACSSK
ncbi:hypothetical protein [Thalassotalea sp. PLHSN55]|uniref:hypothetical protein n=1 Tax=Thalassotalea sp. PLHSN55 TaxID=3435888 RepID=UPI003F855297